MVLPSFAIQPISLLSRNRMSFASKVPAAFAASIFALLPNACLLISSSSAIVRDPLALISLILFLVSSSCVFTASTSDFAELYASEASFIFLSAVFPVITNVSSRKSQAFLMATIPAITRPILPNAEREDHRPVAPPLIAAKPLTIVPEETETLSAASFAPDLIIENVFTMLESSAFAAASTQPP